MASHEDGYLVEGESMNAAADVSTARRLVIAIEDNEARRLGIRVSAARPRVAKRIGAPPGTLENFRRDRLKSVPTWLMARIRTEFVKVLQAEIRRLEHEISVHLQAGADHRCADLAKAQASIQSAKEILTAATRGRS